ncbi:hypothetical protein JRO89_XS09G0204500 [Xanthoceras sorbifolium]|uniref:Ribosomal eL28/Mak16 domain-containing protein n=1 Tax=Xanthoceras sorbifolium TaxID=99658 RepID=A0ABQ8HM43_9ROSI|nr:hypothetical protein JRO89_XS09G0204500 [Xanthoceras sorbifolium]
MTTVPGSLIWEIVKKNNSFLVKQFGRGTAALQFSKESNNLYNLNSFKHSVYAVENGRIWKIKLSSFKRNVDCNEFALRGNVGSSVRKWMSCEAQEGSGVKRGTEAILWLANAKTVTIEPGKDQSVVLATSKTKKQNKPAALLHKSVMKKEFRRMAKAVTNQVADNRYRPDLKKAALARLSAVNRSLKVSKSGAKKRNRQAVRIRGRK